MYYSFRSAVNSFRYCWPHNRLGFCWFVSLLILFLSILLILPPCSQLFTIIRPNASFLTTKFFALVQDAQARLCVVIVRHVGIFALEMRPLRRIWTYFKCESTMGWSSRRYLEQCYGAYNLHTQQKSFFYRNGSVGLSMSLPTLIVVFVNQNQVVSLHLWLFGRMWPFVAFKAKINMIINQVYWYPDSFFV